MMDLLLHMNRCGEVADGDPKSPKAANYDEPKANRYAKLPDPRKLDDWGALRIGAWGASRALDYFETDKSVEANHVGFEGPSPYGRASSVAMAYDPRFAIAFISVRPRRSQALPSQLRRADWQCSRNRRVSLDGWQLPKMCRTVTVNDLPVDAHELIALCAPRPVFVGAGATNGDGQLDAKGMFLAEVGAGSLDKLPGKKDLGSPRVSSD